MSESGRLVSRRGFLKEAAMFVAGPVVGAIVAETAYPFGSTVNQFVEQNTPFNAGAAGYQEHLDTRCPSESTDERLGCLLTTIEADRINAQFVGPVIEEVLFRAVPSVTYDFADGNPNALRNLFTGNPDEKMLSRRTLLLSAASALLFGFMHNLTGEGVNLETIPASQTISGFLYMIIQRKFGILSNIFAHSWHNARAMKETKREIFKQLEHKR